MTPTKTWKAEESRVAKIFGSRRTPLSGINSAHTGADVLPRGAGASWFVEVKHRKKAPHWKLFEEVKASAKKEGRIPVIVYHQKMSHDRMTILSFKDFINLLRQAGYISEAEPGEEE